MRPALSVASRVAPGLDEVDAVAEPGEPDGADETDIAGADDGERTFRGETSGRAYQSSADAGRDGPRCLRSGGPGWRAGRRDRVGCAGARHAVPDRGARTPVHARRRRGGRCRGGRRSASRRRHLHRRGAGRRPSDHPRPRDAPPQRLRVRGSRARDARRGDARHRRRAPASPTSTARRADGDAFDVGAVRFATLDTPGHTPEHVSYAVADTSRGDEPFLLLTGGSLLVGSVGRTDLLGADNARPFAEAMYRLAPRRPAAARGLGHGLPDPRRRVAVLDRDRLDVVVDHRLRAPPRPAPGADGGGGLRAGVAVRAADDPALLRADAPDQPGRTATAGRERPGHRAAVRRRAGGRPGSWRRRGRHPVARQARPPPRPRARCRSRPGRRSGRGSAGWSRPMRRSS